MDDENTAVLNSVDDPSIADPLSEVTRKERKILLIASLISVALAKGGLVPKKIEALGIELTALEINSLLYLLASVLVYLILGFTIYAAADLQRRKVRIEVGRTRVRPIIEAARQDYEEETRSADTNQGADSLQRPAFLHLASVADQSQLATGLLKVSAIRLAFDVYLPFLIGIAALVLVVVETDGWRIATEIFSGLGVLGVTIYGWCSWKKFVHWVMLSMNRFRMWRVHRIREKLEKLPPNTAEFRRLQRKGKGLFERVLKGPWI